MLDVNGDKIPDIVEVGGTLGVLIGKGDGTFAGPVASGQYVVDPAGPQGIIAGDFNGDGIADVALLGGGLQADLAVLRQRYGRVSAAHLW